MAQLILYRCTNLHGFTSKNTWIFISRTMSVSGCLVLSIYREVQESRVGSQWLNWYFIDVQICTGLRPRTLESSSLALSVFRGVLLCLSTERSRKVELEASGSTDTLWMYKSARVYVQEHLNLHLSHYVCACAQGILDLFSKLQISPCKTNICLSCLRNSLRFMSLWRLIAVTVI